MIISLDFDGTVVSHDFPKIGKDIGAVPYLKLFNVLGIKLLLFTCRSGKYLQEAEKWFEENNISIWSSQINPEQSSWSTSPKPLADLYIDDKGFNIPLKTDPSISSRPFVDWDSLFSLMVEKGVFEGFPVLDLLKQILKEKKTPKGGLLTTTPFPPDKISPTPWIIEDSELFRLHRILKQDYNLAPTGCRHDFGLLGLYIPPGKTFYLTCKICGKSVGITGNGPIC